MRQPDFTVEDAYAIARAAHAGQTDQQGRDYFTYHLVPIAESLRRLGPHAEMAGILHDIIEDTSEHEHPWTAERLLANGVPTEVVEAVVSVTRIPGEPYKTMIRRAAANRLGRKVKLADNDRNIKDNAALAEKDPAKAASLLNKRYLPARDVLLAAEEADQYARP